MPNLICSELSVGDLTTARLELEARLFEARLGQLEAHSVSWSSPRLYTTC